MRIFSIFVAVVFLCTLTSLSFGQDTNFNNGPQYLLLGSPMLARSISTPSHSLAGPSLEVGAGNATAGLHAGSDNHYEPPPNPYAQPSINLFPIFYGKTSGSVIEISFSPETLSKPIPSSVLDTGVQIGTLGTAHDHSYGLTLTEAASVSKTNVGHATRVYTNADLERLHTSSKP